MITILIYPWTSQFPVFRHEQYLDLKQTPKQQRDIFRMCVDLQYRDKIIENNKETNRL